MITISGKKQTRVRDRAAIHAARKSYCEVCGAPAWGGPHHIIFRSENGPDHNFNLIQLCKQCHVVDVHNTGTLTKEMLFAIVAMREAVSLQIIVEIVAHLTLSRKARRSQAR